jgi:hypothetical protein
MCRAKMARVAVGLIRVGPFCGLAGARRGLMQVEVAAKRLPVSRYATRWESMPLYATASALMPEIA